MRRLLECSFGSLVRRKRRKLDIAALVFEAGAAAVVESPERVPLSGSTDPVIVDEPASGSVKPEVIAPVLRLQAPSDMARAATRATRYIPLNSASWTRGDGPGIAATR